MNFDYFVSKEEQGRYLTLPFNMPPQTESFSLVYHYEGHPDSREQGGFTSRNRYNTLDLGLIAPDGTQVGASGSDKNAIFISETLATPGYHSCALTPGEWRILLGAYKVAPGGVTVHYELTFTPKHLRLFKGDLHTHTHASDGVLSVEELAQLARRHGLDFLAITDHNQAVTAEALPKIPGLTLIPGVEWTHYQGHANFLGVDRPYDEPFFTNNLEEVRQRFQSARQRGALITINHLFEEECPFSFDLNDLPYDCLEVWNGPMRESNLQALGLWHSLLAAGKKVPICGGSDYHRSQLFIFPGGPSTCIYAWSASISDLLSALKQGHAYIVFAPDGPSLEVHAGGFMLGDSVPFPGITGMQVKSRSMKAGDLLNVVTGSGSTTLWKAEADGEFEGLFRMEKPGFARVEILRIFVPGLPHLPALVSNPIYFEEN